MKKILALIASLCMVLGFATACKKNDGEGGFFNPNKNSTTQGGGDNSTSDNGGEDDEDGGWTGFY